MDLDLINEKLDLIIKRLDELEGNQKSYTIQEVADLLGKSYGHIAQDIRLGLLKAKGKRNKVISQKWLDEYMEVVQ